MMSNDLSENRLHQHMAQLISLEAFIEKTLEQQAQAVADYPDGAAVFQKFLQLTHTHCKALDARLNTLADNVSTPHKTDEGFQIDNRYPMSASLRRVYALLNEAIIDYTTLRIIALRFLDSAVANQENTADLADQHIRDYVVAVRKISRLIHDVVAWELEREGHSCNCTCACCGLGVCICAVYNRETLSEAWSGAGPIDADDVEVVVLPPRPGSNAANAGLQAGDLIVEADGQNIKSSSILYDILDGHNSGESVKLKVRREPGELRDISVVRQ
jgi:hypothetical protein